mgnify:CR=1 FL=1|jgi:hypothetical protein
MNKNNLNDWSISEEMFKWIRNNIKEGSTIIEFGSGLGTIELTKHYTVYSVEQDERWIGKAPDSNYIHAPISNGWYDPHAVFNNLPTDYQLIIVDGPAGSRNRTGIRNYWDKFNLNAPIIMDDTHRNAELNFATETAILLNKQITIIPGHQKSFALIK